MNALLVKDCMTPNPVAVAPQTTLYEASKLMEARHIRRLPVVARGALVGIVTLGDVREYKPSEATTLSIFETINVLAQLSVGDMMTRYPVTIALDETVDVAAGLMLSHKIGGLPVMHNDELVGILTASDIFRVLARTGTGAAMLRQTTVADWMTREPVTIEPGTKLVEAQRLMMDRRVRRLPVMEREQLAGIVTLGDIRGALPSPASMPNSFELTYLYTTLSVDKIMTREPVTIAPDAPLAEAAAWMLDRKIGGLPVLQQDKLVGILSESDIFRALVHMRAAGENNRQTGFSLVIA